MCVATTKSDLTSKSCAIAKRPGHERIVLPQFYRAHQCDARSKRLPVTLVSQYLPVARSDRLSRRPI